MQQSYRHNLSSLLFFAVAFFSAAAVSGCKLVPGAKNSSAATKAEPSVPLDPLAFGMAAISNANPNQLLFYSVDFAQTCLLKKGVLYALADTARPVLTGRTDLMSVELVNNPEPQDDKACNFNTGFVNASLFVFGDAPPKCDIAPRQNATDTTSMSLSGSSTPSHIANWLAAYAKCIDQVPYVWGASSCSSGSDCSGSIVATHKRVGLPINGNQPDLDGTNYIRCHAGDYRPGDHLLLGYNCGSPDHWVTLVNVANPSVGNSPSNTIVDQSTDCAPCCKVAPVRSNLARRAVCACARHKSFQNSWN